MTEYDLESRAPAVTYQYNVTIEIEEYRICGDNNHLEARPLKISTDKSRFTGTYVDPQEASDNIQLLFSTDFRNWLRERQREEWK